jgi:NitT/TauT family transport system substrate-binding protein
MDRRDFLRTAGMTCLAVAGMTRAPRGVMAADMSLPAPTPIVVSVPGPRNLSYLPVDMIHAIGADRAENAVVRLIHVGGGGVALKQLASRNADFAVAGVPAQLSFRANGGEVVTLAAVNDAPLFILMVRADLRNKVTRVADLKGRTIGVNTSSLTSRTTSQQLAERILRLHGVTVEDVRLLPAGQSWESQASMLATHAVDAIMGDEPFASRLLAEKKVFFLLNLADARDAATVPGANFLHAALATRPGLLNDTPQLAATMVAILKRTLHWMATHTPDEIIRALAIEDVDERNALLLCLQKYPNMYSREGKFSTGQLAETDRFFAEEIPAGAPPVRMADIVDDRWVGRIP